MSNQSLVAMAMTLVFCAAAQATVITASSPTIAASVGTSGVASGTNGSTRYLKVAGSTGSAAAGVSKDYSVIDFSGSSLLAAFEASAGSSATVGTISSITLTLFDNSANFGVGGKASNFSFYAPSNNTTSLAEVGSPLVYDTTTSDGLGTQLGTLTSLGSLSYTTSSGYNTELDVTLTGNFSIIANEINGGSNVRFAITSADATTDAVFGGYLGLPPYITPPALSINASTATPEPASLGFFALAGIMLVKRRTI